jgi:hypothetical protein
VVFTRIDGGTRLVDRPRHVLRVTVKSGLIRSALPALQRAIDRGVWPSVVRVLGNPVGTPDSSVAVVDLQPLPTAGPATARDLAVRVEDATGLDVVSVEDAGIPELATEATRQGAFDAAERRAAEQSLGSRLAAFGAGTSSAVRWTALGAVALLVLYVLSRSPSGNSK